MRFVSPAHLAASFARRDAAGYSTRLTTAITRYRVLGARIGVRLASSRSFGIIRFVRRMVNPPLGSRVLKFAGGLDESQ